MANAALAAFLVRGLVALGLLYLPIANSDYPTLLVKVMLGVLVGLAVAVVRDGMLPDRYPNRLSARVVVLLGVEVLLTAAWAAWFFNVHALRQHYPVGKSSL